MNKFVTNEKLAEESTYCREVLHEIFKLGINQRQIAKLIYMLSLELENQVCSVEVAALVKKHCPDAFLSKEDNADESSSLIV